MTGALLRDVRRVKRRGDAVPGLFAGILIFGIVAGVPAALLLVVGNPVSARPGPGPAEPAHPGRGAVRAVPRGVHRLADLGAVR